MRLQGKVGLVTGGGRGIGRAIALALAREGASVVVTARTVSEIEAVAQEVQAAGAPALSIAADATDTEQVEGTVRQTLERFGGIDILVNNAGGVMSVLNDTAAAGRGGPALWEWPEERWDRMIDVHLKSLFLYTKAVMPHFSERRAGKIVNIASAMGHGAWAVGGGYAVAKHAVVALTQTLGLSAQELGVQVNAVSPGLIDTPGQREFMTSVMPSDQLLPMDPPETVAAAVLYLLCEAPAAMVGQSIQLFSAR